MTSFELPGLRADTALGYMGSAGLVWLLRQRGATLRFEGSVPVLEADLPTSVDEAVQVVLEDLCALVDRDVAEWPACVSTSEREVLAAQWSANWAGGECAEAFGVRLDSGLKAGRYAQGTRFACFPNQPFAARLAKLKQVGAVERREGLQALFEGRQVVPSWRSSLLGFSPGDVSDGATYPSAERLVEVVPEMLAAPVAVWFAPRAAYRGRRGPVLRWHLNRVPVGWDGIMALQRRDVVPGLVSYEAPFDKDTAGKYRRYGLASVVGGTEE